MAVNYNINPYQAGAVVIDNRPYLQFFQQQMAQRQAKQDAMDNYFRDLGKNITPTGMRAQDVAGLTQKTNEWRQFYSQNKDAIMNPRLDNGKAYTEYMSRYQDQLAHIEESKQALKTTDELNKTRLNPQTSFILDDPGIVDKIHLHDLPIGDPRRQNLDIGTLAVPPKPWDIKDREAFSKYLTAGLQYNETPGTTQYLPGFKTRTPITKSYSDDNLKVIGNRAMSAYDSDRALQFQTNGIVKNVMNQPALHSQLNSAFRRVYGKDMETPKEVLAAQSILDENRQSIEYKEGEDMFGREKAMENLRFGHEKELKKEGNVENSWVPQYIGQRMTEADAKEEIPIFEPGKLYHPTFVKEISPDPVLMKGLSREGIEPNRVYKTKDGKIWPIFWKYKEDFDANGKKIGTSLAKDQLGNPEIDWDLSNKMDLDQAYLSLGYKGQTKKQLGGTMQGTYKEAPKSEVKYPLPAGKPRTVKQGGHIYTWDETVGEYK